ncbi:MAG: VIT1/CCC1 transporter family protein [Terriglobales bacterium]|jgi:VIT1/CCC1 family predicted Fe2+/Mn2+ transporter
MMLFEILTNRPKHVLEPMEKICEVLFALIMVLTFTCSFSVAGAGREEVRELLIGALGCNLAWGLIDAVFYLMGSFSMLSQGILKLKALTQAATQAEAHQIIADALPPVLACVLSSAELEQMHKKLKQVSNLPARPLPRKDDWLGALGIFLIIVLATLPVLVPLAVIRNARPALRVSNGVAIVMLFLTGYAFGRHTGHRPARMGIAMVILGGAMVAITILLGG